MGSGLQLNGLRKDRTEFPVEVSLSPLDTEDGLLVSAAIRDLTDRIKVEAKFRRFLEAAPDAVVIVDKERGIFLNQLAEGKAVWPGGDGAPAPRSLHTER